MDGRRILIVDDDEIVCDCLSFYLQQQGANCVIARDGAQAVSCLEKSTFDAVLLDQALPDTMGMDIIKNIHPRDVPVLLLTGCADVSVCADFFRAGGADYLQKPVDLHILKTRLRSLIAEKKQQQQQVEMRLVVRRPAGIEVTIDTPEDAYTYCKFMGRMTREALCALYLDATGKLLHQELISLGTANMLISHPRDIIAPAIEHQASNIILAHNHPSGSLVVSKDDRDLTNRVTTACAMLDIDVLDHLIIGLNSYRSLKAPVKGSYFIEVIEEPVSDDALFKHRRSHFCRYY